MRLGVKVQVSPILRDRDTFSKFPNNINTRVRTRGLVRRFACGIGLDPRTIQRSRAFGV